MNDERMANKNNGEVEHGINTVYRTKVIEVDDSGGGNRIMQRPCHIHSDLNFLSNIIKNGQA